MSTEKSKIKKFYFVVKAMALKSIMCYNKSDDISYDGAVIRLTDKAVLAVIIVRRKYIRHCSQEIHSTYLQAHQLYRLDLFAHICFVSNTKGNS